MKLVREISVENFEAWSGGEETLELLINSGKINQFEDLIEEMYPEGIEATTLNDILRFESDWIYETLGIYGEDEYYGDFK